MQQHRLGICCDWMLGFATQTFQDPPLYNSIVYVCVPVEEVGPQVQYGGVEQNGQQEEEGREEEGSWIEGAEYTSTRYT